MNKKDSSTRRLSIRQMLANNIKELLKSSRFQLIQSIHSGSNDNQEILNNYIISCPLITNSHSNDGRKIGVAARNVLDTYIVMEGIDLLKKVERKQGKRFRLEELRLFNKLKQYQYKIMFELFKINFWET